MALLAALLVALQVGAEGAPAELGRAERRWVEQTLGKLDLEEKAAQLIAVRAFAVPEHPDLPRHRELLAQVRDLKVGGVVLFRSELDSVPVLLDELQAAAEIPLLISADLERSLGMRVPAGPVSLPDAMALGAIPGDAGREAARFAGELTGREGRAAGIHWVFAPVADVNVNPANPVINLRSFGEDPAEVGRRVAAFVEGARSTGVLTSVKHFPGHGDTAIDSHLQLPAIAGDRARLDAVELAPFRAAIAAGVDSVMIGHLEVPALDASRRPATLSPTITTTLLREELGFRGLVVTDAMEMRGLSGTWMGEAAVQAVLAGSDVVLLPPDARVAVQSLARAVREGRLPESRLDASVRRVLETKARLGLKKGQKLERTALRREVGRPADAERAREVAAQALTLVRNEGGILPLRAEEKLDVLHLVLSSDWVNIQLGTGGGLVSAELERRGVPTRSRRLGPQISPEQADEVLAAAAGRSHVLASIYVRPSSLKGDLAIDPSHAALLRRLATSGVPLVVVSFSNPYLLAEFPEVPVYLLAFSAEEISQRAAVGALFGETALAGKLPVTLPGLYPRGHGLELPARALVLRRGTPEEAGFRAEGLAEVDRLLEGFVAQGAFPGGVVAVGRRGVLAHLKAFGRQTYEAGAPPVEVDTLYDLASLTKVLATTSVAMAMVDQERLQLDAPLASFLPLFQGPDKERVTIRHLLTHSSGMDWWGPLYQELRGKDAFLQRIVGLPLVTPPGAQMKYSDLGIFLLGEVLVRVSGQPLDAAMREIVAEPLGWRDTGYQPAKALLPRIAPTEKDPWRGRLVHGEVHDENAFALGGVAPHAGLFGTAPELARFAQMMLWHGVYDHRRVFARSTVELFTRPAGQPEGSSRALGWDTKSPEGSSAGTLFSPRSYGHTGFTGTSLWIDPENELFLILLTNRVHPTRENNTIRQVRPAVADAVIRALKERPAVRVGLDRMLEGAAPSLKGKKLGLVAHAASVARDGRHAVPALRDAGYQVVRLFSPEHGLRGVAAAGEHVASGIDPASGLPLVSLYGDNTKPKAADLAGLDALVIDLQDAGVRFYTYASTLLLCLEAAAEAGLPVVVLDRPNPLGRRVEGPARDPAVPLSMVSRAPGPLVHGLTLGEMARQANAALPQSAPLEVIGMAGWDDTRTWAATGRPWVPPSPNLRSAEAALAYPGVALLEATNVTEGRGTDAPFLLFGAPWLDPAKVAIPEVPGYRFEPTTFTPTASAAAPSPKYRDQHCRGWRVHVTDPAAASPWRLGVSLLHTLMQEPGFEFLKNGDHLIWLLGTPTLLEQLRAGATVDQILAG